MRRFILYKVICSVAIWTTLLSGPCWADADFDAGVEAYRQGRYPQAEEVFRKLHTERPEDTRITYYLAITQAQLGRFEQARTFYEEILLLEPQGKPADLAREGLKYLPASTESALDPPPRIQGSPASTNSSASAKPQPEPASPATAAAGGMSAQEMMALQAMMSQMGGGTNPMMMNPMMMMGNPFATGQQGHNGLNGMDPNIMSTMLMNQMLQNFNFSGGSNNDGN